MMLEYKISTFALDRHMHNMYNIHAGLHESLQPCSRAARKWRENEEMKRKWRENEEMERKWIENVTMEKK